MHEETANNIDEDRRRLPADERRAEYSLAVVFTNPTLTSSVVSSARVSTIDSPDLTIERLCYDAMTHS